MLIRQRDEGRAFHLVRSGQAEAIHESAKVSHREGGHRFFTFATGAFFGELSQLLQVPYPSTLNATEATTLLVIPAGSFRVLLAAHHPEFADLVAAEVARRGDVLRSHRDCLRQRGLLLDTGMSHALQWFRERLRRVPAGGPAPLPEEMGEVGGAGVR